MNAIPLSLRLGVGLLVIGSGPLLLFVAADALGLIRDPDPNPVGLGLLFVATVLPAIALTIFGVLRLALNWVRR